jgi:O-antigen/teichoic acid export membrane protein
VTPVIESLGDRTARAAQWRLAASVIGAASQFAVGVLLARLLAPADFGLVALAFVVLGLARPLGDLGIGSAVVQRAELTDRHVRTAFTFSVLLGLAVAIVIILGAPLGSFVVRDPKVTSVLRVLAIGFAVGGTAVVAGALLRRQLDFKTQFFIDTTSYVLGYGGVAVTLALTGQGVWSLVWGGLAQTLLASCAQLAVTRHSIRPLLARRELRELLHFGFGASVNACVNYVALNADSFVVGRWIGATGLGLYNRAYGLMNLPYTYAASVMSSVLFPAFAQVQRESARVRGAFLLLTQLTAMIAAPAMGTLAIVAPHLVRALYGSQWTGAVLPLQILCVAGYFRALYHLGGVVAQSVGRVYSDLRNQTVYAGMVIGGALLGSHYGLAGVAAGVGVAILYMFVATSHLALRATGTTLSAYVRVQLGALITAGCTCGVAISVRLLLETRHASSAVTTLLVLVMAAVPWSAGMLWTLGEPRFEPLRLRLPYSCARLVAALRRSNPQATLQVEGGYVSPTRSHATDS